MLALWLAIALQGAPAPDVTARVDPAHVTAGEALLLTIRARSRSPQPVTVALPSLTGFTVIGSREITEVTLETLGGPIRTTTRELELRAQRPGALVIGPVRVQQGDRAVTTAALTVTVDSAAPGLATAVSPIARRLIESSRPPAEGGGDRVTLSVMLPAESVLVGQQLDVVAVAWFPRELRQRLRRPPILSMQTPKGVWSYPGAAPSEVVASRQVHGRWLDLFVAHEAVFPLAPGRVVIPPATVEYAVPAGFSFFSREDSYVLRSDSVPVTVLPLRGSLGAGGADDPPAVAQDLALDLQIDPPSGRVGEPMAVTATLSGRGNVALWPEPALHWPQSFRAYGGETSTRIEPHDGRVAGTKTFHYLVMPDSAGSFVLPAVRYPYYNLASAGGGSALAAATLPARSVSVAVGAEPRAARALPPLERSAGPIWTEETARDLVPWGWLVLLVGPPLVAWLWGRRRPLAPIRVAAPASPPLSRIGRAEREFHGLLANHVPDVEARDGDGLGRALRAAGVESAVADHVMRLRDRLRAARYGPRRPGDGADLAAELEQVLRVLGGDAARKGRRVVAVLVLAALGALVRPGAAAAQALNAEALYDAGALRAAADSFAARATAEPRVPAHWYNLGATLYRAGADGKATAAWAIAARLAPRDPLVQRARELLPAPDAPSEPLLAVGWATPAEWALAAAVLWVVLWAVAAGRPARRPVRVTVVALLTAGAAGFAIREAARRAQPIAVVLQPATSVRVAPYGSASAAATVEAGAALVVVRTYGRWLEVSRSDGVRGWILATEVTRL
jgi:BatD DUF11 like domain/Bacterial SH3 domain